MKRVFVKLCTLAIIIGLFASCNLGAKKEAAKRPVVIAYVAGYSGLIDKSTISANKISHINYAFVDVRDGEAKLVRDSIDKANFKVLNELKKDNPELKILISLGGWTLSDHFSDAVLTPEGREKLARTAVNIVEENKLDGLDVDWEYPSVGGAKGNVVRPDEDGANYTLMFKAMRGKLDSLSSITGEKYLLTAATGGFDQFLEKNNMAEAQEYLDYVNIMTYDSQSKDIAVHHTSLHPSSQYENARGASPVIDKYIEMGVPVEKLVMGIAFYGRKYQLVANATKGLGDSIVEQQHGSGFSFIKDSVQTDKNYLMSWDEKAQAPFLYNDSLKIFISYDNEGSVKEKLNYVVDKGMAGVMFWVYSSDPKEYLLDAINEAIENK